MGENFRRTGMNPNRESGYAPLRLVTELFPSALAAATQQNLSAGWSVLGFLLFLIFGLAQLCAMWKPIAGNFLFFTFKRNAFIQRFENLKLQVHSEIQLVPFY